MIISLSLVPCFFLCEFLLSEFLFFYMIILSLNVYFSWEIPALMSFSFFIDKISVFLVLMTFWILLLTNYTLGYSEKKEGKIFLTCLVTLIISVMFMSVKLINFFILFELSLLPIILLILGWGYQPERLEAFFNLFFFTSVPSMPFLIFVLINANTSMIGLGYFENSLSMVFFIMSMVFLVKTPMYLFHFWLPKAHVEAPVAGSMILAGIMLKMGGYGLIRFIPLIPHKLVMFLIMSISSWGMIIVCVMCLLSSDLKMIIAYSSVSHMNFMITGLMTDKKVVMLGGLLIMMSHALSSSGMFYLSDLIYKRSLSRSLIFNKSLIIVCPMMSLWWILLCLLNMAFPFSPGNLSEIFIGVSLVKSCSSFMLIILMLYFFLSAYYSIFIYYSLNHGSLGMMAFKPTNLKENLGVICHTIPCVLLSTCSFMVGL